jgi:hypothetical protein
MRTALQKSSKSSFLLVCKGKALKRGHITFFISAKFSTIKEQRFLLFSMETLPIFNLDLIVLRTSISSKCNEILNLNFTKPRSKVIKKFPVPLRGKASVKPESQYKKSSETLDNIKLFTHEVLNRFLRK